MAYNLQGVCILIHGPPKVGKTDLASSFPACQFIATEPGHRFIPEIQRKALVTVERWEDFTPNKINPKAKTVAIDTITGLYRICKAEICKRYKCKHPSEKGEYSRTIWDAINDAFYHGFLDFATACAKKDMTLLIIAHTKQEELEIGAITISKMIVNITAQARSIVMPIPDYIWYIGYGDPENVETTNPKDMMKNFRDTRMLVVKGGDLVEAGTRDGSIVTRTICPLKKPDRENKTGGYWQIISELQTQVKAE